MAAQQGHIGGLQDATTSPDMPRESDELQRDYPPTPSLLRVQKDIADFFADPPPGIFIAPEENDVTQIQALVVGPQGTPYEGGFFRFHVSCTSTYPMTSPKVKILTTDAGRVAFNPNLYASGKVCLSILGTWPGPPWSPAQSLSSLLISIQSLLNEDPYYNEPGFEKGTNQEAAKKYNSYLQHETMRVAVCDTVEDCLMVNSLFPAALKNVVIEKFSECYSRYEEAVKAHLHLSGTQMEGLFLYPSRTFQFEALLSRLRDLKSRVRKLNETVTRDANATEPSG